MLSHDNDRFYCYCHQQTHVDQQQNELQTRKIDSEKEQDLKKIKKGFLPTFGPAFVHLYGSTRDYRYWTNDINIIHNNIDNAKKQ